MSNHISNSDTESQLVEQRKNASNGSRVIKPRSKETSNLKKEQQLNRSLKKLTVTEKYITWFNNEVTMSLFAPAFNHDLKSTNVHLDSMLSTFDRNSKKHMNGFGLGDQAYRELGRAEMVSDLESDDNHEYDTHIDVNTASIGGDSSSCIQMGVEWTDIEKQVFFHCLSRFSIHTIDEWYKQIPTKSKFEIITYYTILRKTYDEIRHQSLNRLLLKRENLPIAYEMDDEWVSLESQIAEKIYSKEEKDLYDGETDSNEQHITDDSSDLFDESKWETRWDRMYSKHGLLEYYPMSRKALNFSNKETKDFLETLVKEYCSQLFIEIISNAKTNEDNFELIDLEKSPVNFENGLQPNGDFIVLQATSKSGDSKSKNGIHDKKAGDIEKERLLLDIKLEDVHRAIIKMKQTSHIYGNHPYTLSEQVPDTLKKFNIETDSSNINDLLSIEPPQELQLSDVENAGQKKDSEMSDLITTDEAIKNDFNSAIAPPPPPPQSKKAQSKYLSEEFITERVHDIETELFKNVSTKYGKIPSVIYKTINDKIPLDELGSREVGAVNNRVDSNIAAPSYCGHSTLFTVDENGANSVSGTIMNSEGVDSINNIDNILRESQMYSQQKTIGYQSQVNGSANNNQEIIDTQSWKDFPKNAERHDLQKEENIDKLDISQSKRQQNILWNYFKVVK